MGDSSVSETRPPLTFTPAEVAERVRAFHEVFYYTRRWESPRFLGVTAWKCPLDLWVYQEILFDTKPDLIIECGTAMGGTALFLASLCEILGRGRVLTIDLVERRGRPEHPRIEYRQGSSLDEGNLEHARRSAGGGGRTMVILDSCHSYENVLAELRAYSPLVSTGCYLIVEDSNINGHPVFTDYEPDAGPGPFEAVGAFLGTTDQFVVDRTCEKYLMTFNPGGYLKRIG